MKRQDFILVFGVENANPNGDPLEGKRPRTNDDGYREVTGECIRRKIRNWFIHMGLPAHMNIYDALKDGKTQKEGARMACEKWLDVRMFGQIFAFSSVKSTNASVHGAGTICYGTSVDPVMLKDIQNVKSTNRENKDDTKGKSRERRASLSGEYMW